MLKFTYKGRFLTIKKTYKYYCIEIQTVNIYSSASSINQNFLFLRNTKIIIFGGISEFLKLIVFGQILADFGSFGQFWAEFVALTMADSMPQLGVKS
jgi:succinate-acetate transporter protein